MSRLPIPVAWLASLLLAGSVIGLAELPYQWLSELGFRLQALWPQGAGGAPRPLLLLAWGPPSCCP